jgi:hypothetical protein
MEHLAQLFGSATRVKLMRLFLFNPETLLLWENALEDE